MSPELDLPILIEPKALAAQIEQPNLIIIDVCKTATYQQAHIPNAIHIPYSYLNAGTKPAPGLLPETSQIQQIMSYIQLSAEKHIVAYDDQVGAEAARFLWLLSCLGHQQFSLLNGGLQLWNHLALPVTSDIPATTQNNYQMPDIKQAIAVKEYLLANLDNPEVQLWDSRTKMEYDGSKKYALFAGHIPNAIHLDWVECLDSQGQIKSKDALKQLLENKGFDLKGLRC